jgi:hypothetical protein
MNLDEFINLPVIEQSNSVYTEAVPVAVRRDKEFDYILYQLYSFYIERRYSRKEHKLLGIVAFDASCKMIDEYLYNIQLAL